MKIEAYCSTLIWCSIGLVIGLQKHLGVFAIVLLFILFYSVFRFFKYVAYKDPRKKQAFISLGLWSLCVVIVVAKHTVVHFQVRNMAESLSAQVLHYYSQHGDYPKNIESLSIKIKGLDKVKVIYNKHQGKPFLAYPVTWIGFDLYEFNFETKKWDYLSS